MNVDYNEAEIQSQSGSPPAGVDARMYFTLKTSLQQMCHHSQTHTHVYMSRKKNRYKAAAMTLSAIKTSVSARLKCVSRKEGQQTG